MSKNNQSNNRLIPGKRKNQNRRGGVVRIPQVPKSIGMPPTFSLPLGITTSYSVNVPGVIASQIFSCNRYVQPSGTVNTSATCSYASYLGLAYERGYVRQSWISVEVVNATMADALSVVLSFDSNSSVSTDIDQLAEGRYSQSCTLGYYSGGNTVATFNSHFTPEKHLGIPCTSSENAVVAGAGPVEEYFWCVSVKPTAAATGNVSYRVKVVYDVIFTELKAPSP